CRSGRLVGLLAQAARRWGSPSTVSASLGANESNHPRGTGPHGSEPKVGRHTGETQQKLPGSPWYVHRDPQRGWHSFRLGTSYEVRGHPPAENADTPDLGGR